MNLQSSNTSTDAFIVGGGPAGLAAAISLRRAGVRVVLADRAQPAIDKACGEGLMPAAMAAVAQLGIQIPSERGHVLQGVCFRTDEAVAFASFAQEYGMGIRRTALHRILVDHALSLGVRLMWHTQVEVLSPGKVIANGAEWKTRWIIGADGQRSHVRRFAQLDHAPLSQRYGFRQHFSVAPWTNCVEVYWASEGQAYVTPIGNHEICLALVTERTQNRINSLGAMFPTLAARLKGCRPTTTERGALTICRRLPSVTRGSVALIGEAAGSIDAITGHGLALAFEQAVALGESLPYGDLGLYEEKNRQIFHVPFMMSQLMVYLGRHPRLQRRIIQACEMDSSFFSELVAVHMGTRSLFRISPSGFINFGWNLAAA